MHREPQPGGGQEALTEPTAQILYPFDPDGIVDADERDLVDGDLEALSNQQPTPPPNNV